VMLLPMLGFFNMSFFRFSFVADHFQYLASIGIITPVSAGGSLLLTRLRGWNRTMGYGFCLALLATLSGLTWQQSRMYRDAETCYRMVIEKNPNSWQAHINVGHALSQRGLAGEAIAHFQKVLEINPNYAPAAKRAHFNLGNALLKTGLVDEAIAHFEKALEIEPNYAEAHINLGSALHRRGRLKEAAAHYQRAVESEPQLALARNNLAWILATCSDASLRNGSKAVELALQADQLSGGRDPIILRTLAAAYAEAGQFSQAVETAQRARQLATDQGKNDLVDALREEIKLYRAASPYHETPD
jgi:protein O-mannosyl-transferase